MTLKDKIKKIKPDNKVYAAFGEIMLRLSSPGHERLFQSPQLEAAFGGGEFNVMASLSIQNMNTRFITALPDNAVGKAALKSIGSYGVDASSIVTLDSGRMGSYFMERGANQRPSKVIYDRENSSINMIKTGSIDWGTALKGCGWFHITGITPALSQTCAEEGLRALKKAKDLGLIISCDLNYRAKLWKYGKKADEIIPEYVKLTDLVIANEEDCQKTLGIGGSFSDAEGDIDKELYKTISNKVMEKYSNVSAVAITLRESFSASHNRWGACFTDEEGTIFSSSYDIKNIVDRVGGGDSFSAGLIYGLSKFNSIQEALEYAAAASCLCHSFEGDVNLAATDEIIVLKEGNAGGRIQR